MHAWSTAALVALLCNPHGPSAGGGADDVASGAFFAEESLTVWLERSQVVPFHLPEPAERDRELPLDVGDRRVLQVLRPPQVLAGQTTGYLRVRGGAEGETELVLGDAALHVRVVAPRAAASANLARVRITTPAAGAAVWGAFTVGAELTRGARAEQDLALRLVLPQGAPPAAEGGLEPGGGPLERAAFTVDAGALPFGPLELVVEARDAAGALVAEDAVRVDVARADVVFAGECESFRWTERPAAFGAEEPRAGRGGGASGGGFVVNAAPEPVWIAPLDVVRAGRYQVMAVARGDVGAGALPSVGLVVDDPLEPRTSARLAQRGWHRAAVGVPVELAPGAHVFGLRFLNDGPTSQLSDRALYLDRFEIARLDDPGAEAGAPQADAMQPGEMQAGAMQPVEMQAADAMMQGTVMQGAMMEAARPASGPGAFLVALARPLDGLHVNGRLRIEGSCVWPGAEAGAVAPTVELVVDGEPVATQQAAEPLFALDRCALAEGEHTLQLVARLADGRRARTPPQTVLVQGRAEPCEPRAFLGFSVLDERWRAAWERALVPDPPSGHLVARLERDLRAEVPLPEGLEGAFDVVLDVRGTGQWRVAATVAVALVRDGAELPLGECEVRGWWGYQEAGRVELDGRPAALAVLVRDVGEAPAEGTRDAVLRSLFLRGRRARPDRNAPLAAIVYPPAGHVASGVDAIVVRAADDDDRLQQAEVLLDGVPQGVFGHVPDGAGFAVLPLLLRGVAPGEHALAVRVADRDGNLAESDEVPIRVEAAVHDDGPREGPYARAVHLLDRFAFGPEPRELAAVLVLGERAWLAQRLAGLGPGDAAALDAARARLAGGGGYNVVQAALAHLLLTDNPVRARLTLWLDNHFSTWMRKAAPMPEWREHEELHRLGPAPFGELLCASATSPAMLWYLDQSASFAGRLNENYAREIMELHTLGVDGGYSQADVGALAQLLCGLTVAEEAPQDGRGGAALAREFRFADDLCDGAPVELLGMRFETLGPAGSPDTPDTNGCFERVRLALELLAAHESTARHVCRALAEHYVSVPAPEQLVSDLARVFSASGGDLYAVLLALAGHGAFWTAPPRVAAPLDYALRIGRCTENASVSHALHGFLERSGMGLFDRASPDGYPDDGAAWSDTNATAQRWRLGNEIPWALRQLVPDAMRRQEGDPAAWRQRVVDAAAVRLTGRPLGQRSNQAALEFLAAAEGEPWAKVDRATVLVARLPEASLR